MTRFLPILFAGAAQAGAQTVECVPFVRQQQQERNVVWDMPVPSAEQELALRMLGKSASILQFWTVESTSAKDRLLDQKLVSDYLPKAAIRITTLDPDGRCPRTRVDQPFSVEINVEGLLTDGGLPNSVSKILLERHFAPHRETAADSQTAMVRSGTPASRGYLTDNGKTVLRFEASSLTATDPTKASGEEHFVIHALPEGGTTPTQIASGELQVWPVASGSITGIADGEKIRTGVPKIDLTFNDLYPRSETSLLLFEGTQISGTDGETIKSVIVDSETCVNTATGVTDLDARIIKDGTYTIALVSDTVYGRELLCPSITFSVQRMLQASATDTKDP